MGISPPRYVRCILYKRILKSLGKIRKLFCRGTPVLISTFIIANNENSVKRVAKKIRREINIKQLSRYECEKQIPVFRPPLFLYFSTRQNTRNILSSASSDYILSRESRNVNRKLLKLTDSYIFKIKLDFYSVI